MNELKFYGKYGKMLSILYFFLVDASLPIRPRRAIISESALPFTFVEIDHEIFSMIILLLPLIQEGLVSVARESMYMKYWLTA